MQSRAKKKMQAQVKNAAAEEKRGITILPKRLAAAQGQVNNKTTFVALPSSMMIYSCRCPGAEQHCL